MEYLSLSKVAESCNYSQEYLSLRARQGKLRAVKIDKNWFTTEDWLKEYIDNVNSYVTERFSLFYQEDEQQKESRAKEESRVSWRAFWSKIWKP